MIKPPTLADLKASASVFNSFPNADRSWLSFCEATAPTVDLARADHRELLLRWLNSWGCRIRYPRPGEPAPFDTEAALWWDKWADQLPSSPLSQLDDAQIMSMGQAYGDLKVIRVSEGRVARTLGPTAATKALFAMRPQSTMAWDAAIAGQLHGSREAGAFAQHLALGREWAQAVLTEAGADEGAVSATVGRPDIPLAKILDEYLYVKLSMNRAE